MIDQYGKHVRAFHEAFGLKVRDTPDVGGPEERVLRVRLMLEEVLEFATAAGVELGISAPSFRALDLIAMAHELSDVAYVTHGTAVQLGIPLLACVTEVHAANMRKAGPDGKPIVDNMGKVQKPEGWAPADVGAVLRHFGHGDT